MENENENGMVLVTILFFMLILVLIGLGISSISNIGVENSVIEKKGGEREGLEDGLVNIVKDELINPKENGKNYSKMEVHIFIDNEEKEFEFDVNGKEDLTEGAITINMNGNSDWEIDYFKKDDVEISYNLTESAINYKNYILNENLIENGNYKIKLKTDKSLDDMQYKLIIKGFYN
ncbi:MAG: hypothetical protein B6I28_01515 [Fusobacteriia bacterium 4572_132]|nr:MAG: hypothetical protein B6I28_01515 [Fusobacteriia bacterium 4572_132]